MLLGLIFLYSYAARQFHLIPARGFKDLEPSNQTQAVAMNVTTIVTSVVCLLLVFSGIWRGFRRPPSEPSPGG
jgi:amino acid transporter